MICYDFTKLYEIQVPHQALKQLVQLLWCSRPGRLGTPKASAEIQRHVGQSADELC